VWLALIYAFVNSVIQGRRAAALLILVVGYGAGWLAASQPGLDLSTRIGVLAWLILLAAVGEIVRAHNRYTATEAARAAEAERVRAEAQRRRAGEERLRIAQDLHDVLAHHISLITVQAGVGLELFDLRPQQARAALAAVKDAGNTALGELREALDILRDPEADLPRTPAPQISRPEDVDALIDAARSAGLRVRTLPVHAGSAAPDRDASGELPILVDQAAYRILQESLTNAVRHAGPGTLVDVLVETTPDRLVVSVHDDGHGASAGLPTGGKGIAGMRERAAALGGTLRAGPRPEGGFAVCATLPLADERSTLT
jgi:signal transduction histidine kinase